MRKVLALIALMTALCVALGGCVLRGPKAQSAGEISLPEPSDEPENMILGESMSGAMSEVTFYRAAQDFSGFTTYTQTLRTDAGASLAEAAVEALLAAGTRATSDVRLLDFEFSRGTATVNLSIDAQNAASPQELLALEAAIGNTLLGIDGVRGVNVLVGGISAGCCQLPVGVQTQVTQSVTAAYAQMQAESERLKQPDAEPIERAALLYFPSSDGQWLLPELRAVSSGADGFASSLIDALKLGPLDERSAVASIPEGAELMEEGPVTESLGTGERVLTLNFSSALANYLAFSGVDVWQLAGSVTLTACSFLPADRIRRSLRPRRFPLCTSSPIRQIRRKACRPVFPAG